MASVSICLWEFVGAELVGAVVGLFYSAVTTWCHDQPLVILSPSPTPAFLELALSNLFKNISLLGLSLPPSPPPGFAVALDSCLLLLSLLLALCPGLS